MKLIEENGSVFLYDNDDKPIHFLNEESELTFLRGRYNICTSNINRLEKLAVCFGTTGLKDSDRELYTAATKERDIICEYITKKNIDYGEINPETGLIEDKARK